MNPLIPISTLMALMLVACGGQTETPASKPDLKAAIATTEPLGQQPPPAGMSEAEKKALLAQIIANRPPEFDSCTLLSAMEVQAVFGEAVDVKGHEKGGDCDYAISDSFNISLSATPYDSVEEAKRFFQMGNDMAEGTSTLVNEANTLANVTTAPATSQNQTGLGDEMRLTINSVVGQASVRKGAFIITITVTDMGGTDHSKQLEELAHKVVDRV